MEYNLNYFGLHCFSKCQKKPVLKAAVLGLCPDCSKSKLIVFKERYPNWIISFFMSKPDDTLPEGRRFLRWLWAFHFSPWTNHSENPRSGKWFLGCLGRSCWPQSPWQSTRFAMPWDECLLHSPGRLPQHPSDFVRPQPSDRSHRSQSATRQTWSLNEMYFLREIAAQEK